MRIELLTAGLLVSTMCLFAGAQPRQSTPSPSSLRGLKAVTVTILGINEQLEKDGLFRDAVQTDVELRLRKSGIQVLGVREATLKTPTLVVLISTYRSKDGPEFIRPFYAYFVQLTLREPVRLERDPTIPVLTSTTWYGSSITGVTGTVEAMPRVIRDSLPDLVDQFINDYLAANPVKQ